MKISYILVSIIFLVLFQNISLASMWADSIWIDDRKIMSDSYINYDIYFAHINRQGIDISSSIVPLDGAGDGATVTSIGSSKYSTFMHLKTGSIPEPGQHFQIPGFSGLYVLYDSDFEIIGTYSGNLDPYVIAYIGETYELGPGQEVELNGYQFNNPGYTQWVAGADYSIECDSGWNIDGDFLPKNLTYEYLTVDLGLTEGTYELELYVTWDYWVGDDLISFDSYDTTTITIVPEPVTILSLGLGGIIYIRKSNR